MMHIFSVFDIVANKNIRICMESHNHKIEKKRGKNKAIFQLLTMQQKLNNNNIINSCCSVIG